MQFNIQITFSSRGIRVLRRGGFQKRGRKPEKVAADWINDIKKEMDVDELISVIVDGKEDITETVKGLESRLLD